MALSSYPITLFNSLSNTKEKFVPCKDGRVGLYSCGPTVYDYAHIGNLRSFVFTDVLVRIFVANGLKVTHIQNITDVGHLTDDGDQGEDKVEKAAEDKKQSAKELTDFYINQFLNDTKALNIISPTKRPRASEFIKEQINFIKELESKGFTYKIPDGIYFDTKKSLGYPALRRAYSNKDKSRLGDVHEKKNANDFALWKFSPKGKKRQMEWDSIWGLGFPGWHIECSGISRFFLGFPFDVHVGGVDHRQVHHVNEIAQNEGVFGMKTINFWLHNEFLTIGGQKMSKSLKNLYTLTDIKKKGFSPEALRYLYLSTHYRQILDFSWDALSGAQSAYEKLTAHVYRIDIELEKNKRFTPNFWFPKVFSRFRYNKIIRRFRTQFFKAINDDINTPKAEAVLWALVRDNTLPAFVQNELLREFDRVLGLGLYTIDSRRIPHHISKLAKERAKLRTDSKWGMADSIREKIEEEGFVIEDTEEGYRLFPK